ncbi:serine protease [Staphylococcus aureus]|uniref:trypsin-like serine peptidase n=1 Tax=Staphylococcus aureus TaxID=1280 RepID=UPI0022EBA81B|nr:serine protease [Staphylococcus aureus]MDA3753383.1 serine protease [Staphylococcus aureus]MDA4836342.1 serine protease [Staphylococcus aureus]MDA5396410.1 serine protease [Staphylococcus aureus]MDA5401636.1 serine protease [Staphylococcus aureus]MDA5406182.1 serine protease [Staphylococcus aureus]
MNKNIIIKSIAALTILTSVTGVGTTIVEGIQQTAKAEHNVTQVQNTSISPYKGIVRIGSATGFVVGKNTILTNKHVLPGVQVGSTIIAHSNGENDTGGFYKVKKIVRYAGQEDIAILHVEDKAVHPKNRNFKDYTGILKIASEAKENERISIVGYPEPYINKFQMYESTGKVLSVKGNMIISDAFVEPGNSGSAVFNSKYEVVGVHFGGNGPANKSTKGYAVYFSPEIKKFIADNTDK